MSNWRISNWFIIWRIHRTMQYYYGLTKIHEMEFQHLTHSIFMKEWMCYPSSLSNRTANEISCSGSCIHFLRIEKTRENQLSPYEQHSPKLTHLFIDLKTNLFISKFTIWLTAGSWQFYALFSWVTQITYMNTPTRTLSLQLLAALKLCRSKIWHL